MLYALVRPLLGTRVALLAGLALTVAPFHVSYSNYSRGFMLAGLGLLLAAWAVARLAQGAPGPRGAIAARVWPRSTARPGERRSGRWWWLWLGGATLALHSEYDAALFLAPLVALPALWRARGWRTVAPLALLPAATLLPLTGEVLAGLDQIDVTKLTPPSPEPSLGVARDAIVSLMVGTHGLAGSSAVRALQLLAVVAALAVSSWLLWRRPPALSLSADAAIAAPGAEATARPGATPSGAPTAASDAALAAEPSPRRETAFWILAVAPATSVALHALAALVGPNLLDARYLVTLIPFLVALLAAGVVALPWRWATPATTAVLLALGVAVFVQRFDRELQPDVAPAGEVVRAAGARTVLTNSPVIAYYLRDLEARVDRPFGLADSEPRCAAECPAPIAVVEDARLPGGVRPGPGEVTVLDPLVVRIRP